MCLQVLFFTEGVFELNCVQILLDVVMVIVIGNSTEFLAYMCASQELL